MDDVQDQRVLRKVGLHLLLQRLGAIGEGHVLVDMGPLALGHPLRQPTHRDRFPLQGGAQLFALRPRAGRRFRATGILQPGGYHLLGRTLVGADGVESRDHGFLLLGPLLPLAQARGRALGGGCTIGTPLPSACTTRMVASGGGAASSAGRS
jgi:hypothetical protein